MLSGGERNRVHLAKMLKSGANVLLLDEPTNDLDVDTLRALEEALEDFAGCAVIISHDRWFLDRIATHILAFEGDSHVEWFEGNFAGLRGGQEAPPRHRPHDPAPDQVQEVLALRPALVAGTSRRTYIAESCIRSTACPPPLFIRPKSISRNSSTPRCEARKWSLPGTGWRL